MSDEVLLKNYIFTTIVRFLCFLTVYFFRFLRNIDQHTSAILRDINPKIVKYTRCLWDIGIQRHSEL